jgi:hypothetical protein
MGSKRQALNRRPSARNQLENKHDYCRYEQQVDKPSQGVTAHQSNQPQNQEDHKNCPKLSLSPEAKNFLPQSLRHTL